MNIPKYIIKKLDRRRRLAEELSTVSSEIDNWLESKGIDITDPDIADCTLTGARIYCEPSGAEATLIDYLEKYNE